MGRSAGQSTGQVGMAKFCGGLVPDGTKRMSE